MTTSPPSARRANPAFWVFLVLMLIFASIALWGGWRIFSILTADLEQLTVAVLAAAVMGTIGYWVTAGKGALAGSSQIARLMVWAALGLSIASAVTTTTGLQDQLTRNAASASLVQILLAGIVGIGIQALMLVVALQIGESAQRLGPHRNADPELDLAIDGLPDSSEGQRQRKLKRLALALSGILFLFVAYDVLTQGSPEASLLQLRQMVGLTEGQGEVNLMGVVLLVIAFALLYSAIPRFLAMIGLIGSVGLYLLLLTFSSGFGYMFYVKAFQEQALIDNRRDAEIRTQTPEFVDRIQQASAADMRDSRIAITGGPEFADLGARIDRLAQAFTDAGPRVAGLVAEQERIQREAAEAAARLVQSVAEAEAEVARVQAEIARAERELRDAVADKDARRAGLVTRRDEFQALRDETARGDDGTLAVCGPICRGYEQQRDQVIAQITAIDDRVADAEAALASARASLTTAEDAVERAKTAQSAPGGSPGVAPAPIPVIRGAETLVAARSAFAADPTEANLQSLQGACEQGRQMLISIPDTDPTSLPDCDTAEVAALIAANLRIVQTNDAIQAEGICERTPEELASDSAGVLAATGAAADPSRDTAVIPDYLLARVQWVVRCMDQANSGSERMQVLALEVKEFENRYMTGTYDVRRMLDELVAGQTHAQIAALFAVVIDLAILFAGLGANAQRGRELREDHRDVPADRLADRVRNTLFQLDPTGLGRIAGSLVDLIEPLPFPAEGRRDFVHALRPPDADPEAAREIKRVMLAAGPELARFVDVPGRPVWHLHRGLVALLIEIATTAGTAPSRGVTGRVAIDAQGMAAVPLLPDYSGSANRSAQQRPQPPETPKPDPFAE